MLVIGLEENEDVFIDHGEAEIRIVVKQIISPNRIKIRVEKSTINHEYEIAGDYRVSLGSGKSIGLGSDGTFHKARLTIQAPRNVEIERGKWRKNQEKKS